MVGSIVLGAHAGRAQVHRTSFRTAARRGVQVVLLLWGSLWAFFIVGNTVFEAGKGLPYAALIGAALMAMLIAFVAGMLFWPCAAGPLLVLAGLVSLFQFDNIVAWGLLGLPAIAIGALGFLTAPTSQDDTTAGPPGPA